MPSAQWALQQAVYGVVSPAIAPKLLLDSVPQEPAYPYMHIGEFFGGDWDTDDSVGREIFFNLHSWSRYDGTKELHELMDAVKAVLHNQQFVVSGEVMVLCLLDYMNTNLDPDGLTRHGVQRFRVLMEGT
jgi:hypothetical protein